MFKTYRRISSNNICRILRELKWNPYHILENKEFVKCFDSELSDLLDDPVYGTDFVISYYLEEHKTKLSIYIPETFNVERRIKLVNDYLISEKVNPNNLQLIINSKSSADLPITPKMKMLADKRNTEFWKNKKSAIVHKQGFCVSFGPYAKEKGFRLDKI